MGCCLSAQHLAQCASMDQDHRAAHQSTAKPQTPAESHFQLCSTIQLLYLLHKLHQIPLSTFTTWKTFTPILFSAFLSLAFKPTPCHHSPSFLTPLKLQHSCSEAAALVLMQSSSNSSKSQWHRCWCPSRAHPLQLHSPPPKYAPGQQQLHQ